MLDVFGIVLAMAMLLLLTWLRVISAVIVPRIRAALANRSDPPAGFADLFEEADRQLRELGFTTSFWVKYDDDPPGSASIPLQCVYRHGSQSVLASVMAPVELNQPNRPVLTLSTVLADNTTLTSYAYSAGSACFDGVRHRRRNVPAADAAGLWQAHFLWRHEFAQADAALPQSDAQLVQDSEQRYAEMLADLMARGDLYTDRNGALRFGLGGTLRVLWRLLRAPKVPRSNKPVPFERQVALLPLFERLTTRAPTRRMQWGAFFATAGLFAAVGAAVWSGYFALVLLGVLVVHEGGHFLAMRWLGYRNVQMVLVPLLGGVTTGVERDPNGTHRALVSLAGPLPGIALGWALLWAATSGHWTGVSSAAGTPVLVVVVLLTVNYLNLLPIPPLDGGHFVQSLVPRGWARTGVVLVGVLAIAGIALAWWMQSIVLGVVVALQLFALRGLWRDAHLAKLLHRQFAQSPVSGYERDAQILAAVNAQEPKLPLQRRYVRMTKIRNLVDLQPPRAAARVMLTALYLLPFLLPFFVLPRSSLLWQAMATRHATAPSEDPTVRYRNAAATLSLPQLLEGIAQANADNAALFAVDAGLPKPAAASATPPPGEKDFSDAEARLGGKLPGDYHAMIADPHRDAIALRAPAELRAASEVIAPLLAGMTIEGAIHVEDFAEQKDRALPPALVGRMAVITGKDEEPDSVVLVDVSGDAALGCCRVLVFEDDITVAYSSLREWLRTSYANAQFFAAMGREQEQKRTAALEESKDWNVARLLDRIQQASPMKGLNSEADLGPRSQQDIAKTEEKLGRLPPDYRELMTRQNGVPALSLLPLAQVSVLDPASQEAQAFLTTQFFRADASGKPVEKIPAGTALQDGRALVIGALRYSKPMDARTQWPWILAVERDGGWRYLDLRNRRAYADLREFLHYGYAQQRSMGFSDD